jgi:hypothetical protein
MRKNIYLAMLVILVSGIAAGFFAGRHYAEQRFHRMIKEGPQRLEELLTERLVQALKLSREQMPAIREPVRRLAEDFEAGFKTHRAGMEKRAEQMFAEIRPLLDPSQQNILDHMTAEDLRPRPPRPPRDDHRPPPPPPPPPPHP